MPGLHIFWLSIDMIGISFGRIFNEDLGLDVDTSDI